ncbi:MotA/TolQ/ExbB proton channel family protein [Alcanivorax sp. 1008]|uniref:MotA/TolQ/ExbB proton channel family protein n=1 Tax=Alcanivorax sp. 1008 TaxID=2816853 RepID=UPI001D38E313|nr:MotA/TolQ/ExbB proton channel family protein [Alcanivorax sp. 1008]
MLEIVQSGGWLMLPILICSLVAMAIVGERFWTLRRGRLAPEGLVGRVQTSLKKASPDKAMLQQLASDSPLGRILATGLANAGQGRDIMKESIEEVASQVVHDLERFLNTLGTVAAITPMLGLLGTVVGMIDVFSAIMLHGAGDAALLAGGISKALITTAAGLSVAIPAMFFHRFFVRRVEEITVAMEQQAIYLVDMMHGDRVEVPQVSKGSKA